MTDRQPLADIAAEARHVLAGCAAHQVTARLIGGLAVARHQHLATPTELRRSYGDIDIVIGRKEGRRRRRALRPTRATWRTPVQRTARRPADAFLRPDNGRQLDVFVGSLDMCHALT